MSRHHLTHVLVLALAFTACGEPHAAPVPLAPGGPTLADAGSGPRERLSYSSEAFVGGWQTHVRFSSRPGAKPSTDVSAKLVMRFVEAAKPTLDVFLEALALSGEAAGQKVGPHVIDGSNPKYAALVETALSTIAFSPQGPTTGTPNPKNPAAKQGAHLIHSTVFSIPPIPSEPVGVGARWRATRVVPRSNDAGPEVAMDILYTLTRFEPCGGGSSARCAIIMSTGDTGARDATHKSGTEMKVHYTLSGETKLAIGGALVTSETHMTMDLDSDVITLALDGVITTTRR